MSVLPRNDPTQIINNFVIDRQLNYNISAEGGKNVPPRQKGSFRVPVVTRFRMVKKDPLVSVTTYILIWLEPNDDSSQPIDHYNIYVRDTMGKTIGSFSVATSPAEIVVATDGNLPILFTIQTVLKNGSSSSIGNSPTIAG